LFAQNNAYSFFFSPFLEDQFLPAASPESLNQPPGHSLPLETQIYIQSLHENTLFLLLNPFPVSFLLPYPFFNGSPGNYFLLYWLFALAHPEKTPFPVQPEKSTMEIEFPFCAFALDD
jgi:hypothetical protein